MWECREHSRTVHQLHNIVNTCFFPHSQHVFDHLNQQPHEPHGVDFSRVRHWVLNGWSKFYRQTLLFGSFPTAEVNSLLNKYCYSIQTTFVGGKDVSLDCVCYMLVVALTPLLDFAGRLRVSETCYPGSVCQVMKQAPQAFHRISCPSHTDLSEARFSYFIEQVGSLVLSVPSFSSGGIVSLTVT